MARRSCNNPPVKTRVAAPIFTEREIQRQAVEALRRLGHTVWNTSTYRSSRCTRGTPDLIVSLKSGGGLCVAIEIKGPKTKLSAEQLTEESAGDIVVCRSVEEVLGAIDFRPA